MTTSAPTASPSSEPTAPITSTASAADWLFDDAPCGLLITDGDDCVVRANATFLEWTGHSAASIVGTAFQNLLEPGSRAFYGTRILDELWAQREVREISMRLLRADGEALPILVNARMRADGRPGGHLAVFDATSRQSFERDLLIAKRQAEASESSVRILQEAATGFLAAGTGAELARAIGATTREAFMAADTAVVEYAEDGSSFQVLDGQHLDGLLAAVRASRGSDARALGPDQMVVVTSLDDAFALSDDVGRAFRAARASAFSAVAIADGDVVLGAFACLYGRPREFPEPIRDLHRALARQAGLAFSRVRLQERLIALASHDPLTGVANRASIDDEVARAFMAAQRNQSAMALLFLDLDGFKPINDSIGHRIGDDVLQSVADRIRGVLRDTDAVGRFGGDEFVVVCGETDAETAAVIAERIRAAVSAPMDFVPAGFGVSASIGVAVVDPCDPVDDSAESLVRRADAAMYAAKRDGRNRVMLA